MQVRKEQLEIPGLLRIEQGQGNLTRIVITSPLASAEIYTHGAHVTRYEPAGQPPVLWMSQSSWFDPAKPIRGGVPICFPWFGPKQGDTTAPAHGFARLMEWEIESTSHSNGTVVVTLVLRTSEATRAKWPADFVAKYVVSVGAELSMQLSVQNTGQSPIRFEEALHTYLTVGDIHHITIEGLGGANYIDKMDGAKTKPQSDRLINFTGETDRVYLNTTSTCIVHDPDKKRRLEVSKSGSNATVVWNPWINKAKAMPDFGDEEWPGMVCVETVNVAQHAIELPAGLTHVMTAKVRSWPTK